MVDVIISQSGLFCNKLAAMGHLKMRKGDCPWLQQEMFEQLLRRLDTTSLAALSSTSKTWHNLVQPHLRSMVVDLSLGQEPTPITINLEGQFCLPRQFLYQAASPSLLPVVWDAGCVCQATAAKAAAAAAAHRRHGNEQIGGTSELSCTKACICSVPPFTHGNRQQQIAAAMAAAQPRSCAVMLDNALDTRDDREQPDDQQPRLQQASGICSSNSSTPQPQRAVPDQSNRDNGCIWECGPACSCGLACPHRTTQTGIVVELSLRYTAPKGWAVFAAQDIPYNTFVCLYVGEHISSSSASQRLHDYDAIAQQHAVQKESGRPNSSTRPSVQRLAHVEGHALLVVREHLPGGILRSNIDATHISNVARFINHACDGGNLTPVVVHRAGCLLPEVALFASRDIQAQEELTFAYGPPCRESTEVDPRRCHCGTSACLGFLPHTAV